MNEVDRFLDNVVHRGLIQLRIDPIPIYTFGFYHDHESSSVSICVDTKESSSNFVRKSNQSVMEFFARFIDAGSYKDAFLFQANVAEACHLVTLCVSIWPEQI
jgi:hypothetical protein